MRKNPANRTLKTIIIDGEQLTSEVPTASNNVIIFRYVNAVIYTNKGEHPVFIRRKDLDDFIKDFTWRYNGTGYACTQVSISQLKEVCLRYNLDIEAFGVFFNDIDVSGKQVTVYLHRYIMGFFNREKREEMKITFADVIEKYELLSIDDMVIDHDMYNSRIGGRRVFNYSDMMRIVPPPVNKAFRVGEAQRNRQDIFPIVKDENTGLFQLEIKEVPSPMAATIGLIFDLNKLGVNVARLQQEMEKKRQSYLAKYSAFLRDNEGLPIPEQFRYKSQLQTELMNGLVQLGKVLEEQGKVKVITF